MKNELNFWRTTLAGSLVLCVANAAWSQGTAGHAVGQSIAETQFTALPGLPSCTPGAFYDGLCQER